MPTKTGPQALFAGRILAFDEQAALLWARLMAEGKAAGRPRNRLDMIIASIAGANDCIVVTANERDFIGLTILNPLSRNAQLARSMRSNELSTTDRIRDPG